jgi:short-subunit dehydrogenase
MEANAKAPTAMIYAVLPGVVKRGRGTVITVGSAATDLPLAFQSSYDASKLVVQKVIQILDMELQRKRILNVMIHLVAIKTNLSLEKVAVWKDMRELMDPCALACAPCLYFPIIPSLTALYK